ncbi:serine hydrolase domain-containing protein [Kitasatospora sp. NPDC096128]|uniref:serine hydrolase domain-containing protein n=1 Tax=Kitasatospora sp. NPDC096128 TaxID=3155547 RepID=UPI0033269346
MDELARLVQQTADRLAGRRVGVVVAGLAGDAVAVHGAGRTGPGGQVPGARTLFDIGSVTKVFTSLTLAKLALDGVVRLDEPLAEALEEVLPRPAAVPTRHGEAITLRHLATHTSGLPRLPRGMVLRGLLRPNQPDPYAHCTTERILSGLARTRLRSVPGRDFRYSNLGAGLLGLALAHRADTGYGELVAREVCTPLGLTDTCLRSDAEQSARLAPGHAPGGRPVPSWDFAALPGMGGLRSTAADLAAFLRAQLAAEREPDAPLAPSMLLTRETRHRVNPCAWTHLGWLGHRLHAQQGRHLQLWHNGGTGGSSSFLAFDPEQQVGVVVLANSRRPVDAAGTALLRRLQVGLGAAGR